MNQNTLLFASALVAISINCPIGVLAASEAPGMVGTYRMEYSDIFYGNASYEVSVNSADNIDGESLFTLHGFPAQDCNPVKMSLSPDQSIVYVANNQHSLTDEYNTKMYLQYVDPKVADEKDNYIVPNEPWILNRDVATGRIAWFGGDFEEGVGYGHFVVVGAMNQGYLCFINRVDMTPLNADFSGTHTREDVVNDYSHGCLVEQDGDTLKIYGLLQLDFAHPVSFKIDYDTRMLYANDQLITQKEDYGPIYLINQEGERSVTATAEVTDGHTMLTVDAFQGEGEEIRINTGLVAGMISVPFDIFAKQGESGVATVEDIAVEKWYTPTGIEVSRPTSAGIYIHRIGTKSEVVKF